MKISVIVFISILFVTCSENTTESAVTDFKIIGKVSDTNGNLLNDVNIYLVYHLIDIPVIQQTKIANPDTVSLVSFSANVNVDNVTLNWSTETEVNNSGFEIERNSGNRFEKIGFVPGFGTSTETHIYSYVDNSLLVGTYQYRLKQIDYDGTFQYSNVVEVEIISPDVFALKQNYPNPVHWITRIQYTLSKDAFCHLEIINYYTTESLVVLVNEEQSAGIHTVSFNNVFGLTNNIYRVNFNAVSGGEPDYEQDITILLNEDDIVRVTVSQPIIKTVNGNFEIKLSDLPINKNINITLEDSPDIIKQQLISKLLKFVLYKDGYNVLENEFLIDMNGNNEFNFVMERH